MGPRPAELEGSWGPPCPGCSQGRGSPSCWRVDLSKLRVRPRACSVWTVRAQDVQRWGRRGPALPLPSPRSSAGQKGSRVRDHSSLSRGGSWGAGWVGHLHQEDTVLRFPDTWETRKPVQYFRQPGCNANIHAARAGSRRLEEGVLPKPPAKPGQAGVRSRLGCEAFSSMVEEQWAQVGKCWTVR